MKGNILIVDDEMSIIMSITRMLTDTDHRVLAALNADEALEKLKENTVDLVISDFKMPGMTGIEFLKKIQLQYPEILTILMTAHADLELAIDAINEAGIYKFVQKPWNEADFTMTINRAVELRHLLSERRTLKREIQLRDAMLTELEKRHPGITKVNKDENGCIIIEEFQSCR